ncbi:hypothetical protein C8J57DRAFT_1225679 [Mycena rebaudengoi]|nr:hypothetical protein C8J57DRAFT_1225679 [Mycena rebaudengoi]
MAGSTSAAIDDDFMLELQALSRAPSSPPPMPPAKRRRLNHDQADGDDDENDLPLSPAITTGTLGTVNPNVSSAVMTFAAQQKLRPEQLTQVQKFLTDVQTVQNAKLFITNLAMRNELVRIITSQPKYAATAELKVNIKAFAIAVLLSPNINILKKKRFDLPVGIEDIPAEWGKIITLVQDTITQVRSDLKKDVVCDLKPQDHQNLYSLAQTIVSGTNVRISKALCGRIALMRKVYLKIDDAGYWDALDAALAAGRTATGGSAVATETLFIMFEGLIKADKALHGNFDIVFQDADENQQEVADLIEAARINIATTAASPSAVPVTPGEGEEERVEAPSGEVSGEASGAASGSGADVPA